MHIPYEHKNQTDVDKTHKLFADILQDIKCTIWSTLINLSENKLPFLGVSC